MADKTVVVLGTATPGGGFPAYGGPYCETLNEVDPTLRVEPRNTKGSTENVPLLEQDKLDLGLATGEVTCEAIAGIGRPAKTRLRIINATYSWSPGPRCSPITSRDRASCVTPISPRSLRCSTITRSSR